MTYSRAALQQFREQKERLAVLPPVPPTPSSLLDQVPPDAPMDEGLVLGYWNGERFVSRERWLATAPIVVEPTGAKPTLPHDAECVTTECSGTPVWLVRDGDRWLMFAVTRKSRRKDFASPFLEHAIRAAEAWYGSPTDGWRVDGKREGENAR